MVYLVGTVLFIIAALFVGYPLFRPQRNQEAGTEQSDATFHSILEELELDYEMGNISEDEFRELDAKYRARLNY